MLFDEQTYYKTLEETFRANREVKPSHIALVKLISGGEGKYVGCVHCKDNSGRELCVNINNSAEKTLLYFPAERRVEYIGNLTGLKFSYTGGGFCKEDGKVYGFLRNSNKILKADINALQVEEVDVGIPAVPVEDKKIIFGHHYGGIMLGNVIVSPPRLHNELWLVDVKSKIYKRAQHEILEKNNYNGAVLHPNGKIYFTPMKGSRVAELDLNHTSIKTIGEPVADALFGGITYADGCIYSFSQNVGLYRISPSENKVERIRDKTDDGILISGCYGTIVHYNGKIYNIPGNSEYLYEYDPASGKCRAVCQFKDGRFNAAKWAGGALLENGNVYLCPAFGRFVAEVEFEGEVKISDGMRQLIYENYFKVL